MTYIEGKLTEVRLVSEGGPVNLDANTTTIHVSAAEFVVSGGLKYKAGDYTAIALPETPAATPTQLFWWFSQRPGDRMAWVKASVRGSRAIRVEVELREEK
jgi:hypothetical protein